MLLLFAAAAAGGEKIVVEAEDARGMSVPFTIRRDERASGGMSVGILDKSETGRDAKPPAVEGSARYRFKLEKSGKYAFWVRKWWMDGCGNSVKLNVNEGPAYLVGEDGTYRYWDWIKMPIDLDLEAGEHTMQLHNNEDGIWIDQIVITNDLSYVPAGQESPGETAAKEHDIYMADDFMRAEDQSGAWTVVSGSWKVSALDHPERSANAFQYVSEGEEKRLVVTGYPFWHDYAIEVAAMSRKRADLGIVLLRSDEPNYYLWRVPVAPGRRMKFSRFVEGKETVLFEANQRLRAGQWYKLGAAVYRGNILLEIDDNKVAKISDLSHLKGTIGLYSDGVGQTFFDDAFIKSVKLLSDDFSDTRLSGWQVTEDAFRVYTTSEKAVALTVLEKGFGRRISLPSGDGPMLLATGKGSATMGTTYWHDYTLAFDVLPHLPAAWSVSVGRTENEEGTVFVFRPTERGVSIAGTDVATAVDLEGEWTGAWHRVRIDNRTDTLTLSVDGRVVMQGGWPDTAGRAGFETEGPGVLFDNVSVRTYGRPTPEEKITPQFTLERTMMNWASLNYEWEADTDGKKVWNRLDFLGDVEIGYRYGGELPADESIRLGISPGKGEAANSGFWMIVSKGRVKLFNGERGSVEADLRTKGRGAADRRAAFFGKHHFGARVDLATLRRAGDSIVASVNGRDVLRMQVAGRHGARRLWVGLSESAVKPERIWVRSKSTRDYVMGKAPVDWRISNGHFKVTNRWKCDPRWSWFCLMSPAESVMWNKRSFSGDVSADMWVGMKMELRRRPTYGDPGDMNLTICADGRSVGTGYSFIYGGYDNTASKLLRNDKVVAETAKVLAPSTRHSAGGLHRRWFHLALKKKGNTVGCFLDEELILKYEDPEPLTGNRVAAWTFDNGMMMSRIRISAQKVGAQESPVVADPSEPDAPAPPSPGEPQAGSFRAFDFESSRDGWGPRQKTDHFTFDWDPEAWELEEDNAREVDVRTAPREDGGRCLEVENLSGGGTFAVEVPLVGADLVKFPVLSFDYAIPRGVFVNLYMKAGPRFYSLSLTGHSDSMFGVTALGEIGIKADGKWHTAKVNLRDRFLGLRPQAKSVVLEDVFVGNMDNRGYLVCGIGGNLAGSLYRFDNVRLFKVTDDTTPPKIGPSLPWEGGDLRIQFDDIGGAGVDPKSIVLRCGDRIYSLDHPAVSHDPLRAVASVDPALAGLRFTDGGEAVLHVVKLADFAGNSIDKPVRCAWKTKRSDDTRPPAGLVLVPPVEHPANNDFENDLKQWQALDGKYPPEISRCGEDPAQGNWCLQVLNPRVGGTFRCRAVSTPYDAGKFPIVSFYYRIGKDVDVDMSCVVNGMRKYIRFSDENSGLIYIGSVPDVAKDGKWHRASVDLAAMLSRNDPYADRYLVGSIEFGDWGWMGNARGARFFIDDFRVEPVCGAAEASKEWRWAAQDPFGVPKAVYRLAGSEWLPIPKAAARWLPAKLARGANTVAVKACDPAGNWTPAVDRTVVCDPAPPAFGNPSPEDGASTASGRILLPLSDDISGLDKLSIAMTVNGKRYGVKDPQLTYEFDSRALVFRRWGGERDLVFEDGKPVDVAVSLRDNAGNESRKKFSWTMDFAKDTAGPPPPYVAPVLEGCLFKEDFEGKVNAWRKSLKPSGARVRALTDCAATGRRCLTVFNTYEGDFRLELKPPRKVDAKTHPLLVFDYRIEGGARFNLFLRAPGGSYDVQLTEPKRTRRVTRLGRVKMVSDGKWHRAVVNLGEMIESNLTRRSVPGRGGYPVSRMYFGNATRSNPREAKLYLDNVCLAAPPKTGKSFTLEWTELVDATGIASYSYCLDRSAKTEPTEEKEKATSESVTIPGGGKWFFHVRAKDGAGNWGETSHYRVRPLAF